MSQDLEKQWKHLGKNYLVFMPDVQPQWRCFNMFFSEVQLKLIAMAFPLLFLPLSTFFFFELFEKVAKMVTLKLEQISTFHINLGFYNLTRKNIHL